MKTKYEDLYFFQGNAGSERIAGLYREQQESPDRYFQIQAGNKLTGIPDKTVKYLFVPECITEIRSFAFAGCNQLTGLFIPWSVRQIQGNLFANCAKLTWIVVDEENPYYDSRNSCNAIIDKQNSELIAGCGNTIVPADVKGIGQFAFYMQDGLKSITIPNSISYISECAFKDCTELVDVKLSVDLKEIGFGAFSGCIGLFDVVIPTGITDIAENAFESVNHIRYNGQLKKAPWGAWSMN